VYSRRRHDDHTILLDFVNLEQKNDKKHHPCLDIWFFTCTRTAEKKDTLPCKYVVVSFQTEERQEYPMDPSVVIFQASEGDGEEAHTPM
jgi:hypothetical protein